MKESDFREITRLVMDPYQQLQEDRAAKDAAFVARVLSTPLLDALAMKVSAFGKWSEAAQEVWKTEQPVGS